MNRLIELYDRIMVTLAALTLTILMTMTTLSALGRYFFNRPVPDNVTVSQMMMVLIVFLPLAYVQKLRHHVSVTLFSDWLPPGGLRKLEGFGLFLSLIFFGLIAATAVAATLKAYHIGESTRGELDLPTWPAHAVMAVGVIGFVLRLFLELVLALMGKSTAQEPPEKAEGV
ncbi:TRAP transporter small permease [Pararhodobacter aggregans]|uniref:TRAP transporter small permease n=1 Tax=Pararhodobacter aggregans TaxID=404875 RepID=UPI000D4AFF0B|nr:TRAP transporter small permease [Pararhodobacter aggregans]PTX03033.1 TRAP-type C4-dicarboxylate transport system permease small subunit [Pararhodobacter aggregans]